MSEKLTICQECRHRGFEYTWAGYSSACKAKVTGRNLVTGQAYYTPCSFRNLYGDCRDYETRPKRWWQFWRKSVKQ